MYRLDKIFQLTIGHAFSEPDHVALLETQSSNINECDFDVQSDLEDENSRIVLDIRDNDSVDLKHLLQDITYDATGNKKNIKSQDSSSRGPESSLAISNSISFSLDAEPAEFPAKRNSLRSFGSWIVLGS